MTKSPAQIFHEATGGKWHEVSNYVITKDGRMEKQATCSCSRSWLFNSALDEHIKASNPTYSNPADILRRMKEFLGEEGFEKFIKTISLEKHVDYREAYGEPDERYFVTMSIIDFINGFILNAPALLDEAIEYLQMKGE